MLLIVIGMLHTKLVVSSDGCGKQFMKFSESYFFKICGGLNELPATVGKTNFEVFASFWFFYFGIFLIPLGLLVHSIEKEKRILPHYFTISYLIFVLIGCYMVPNSGMTLIMLPHAIYMLLSNYIKARKRMAC
jgi:succinate-acetate transporter protein